MSLDQLVTTCFFALVGIILLVLYNRDDRFDETVSKKITDLAHEQNACKKDLWSAVGSIRENYVTEKSFDEHKNHCPIAFRLDSKDEIYNKLFEILDKRFSELNEAIRDMRSELVDFTHALQNKLDDHIQKGKD